MIDETTADQRRRIAERLAAIEHLSVGVGTEQSPCSIAAINLALSGRLTDDVPECASPARCAVVIQMQDRIPAAIRDSAEWRAALPLLAGTRGMSEDLRPILIPWMWERLADPAVIAAVPERALPAWRAMLAAPGDVGLARAAHADAHAAHAYAHAYAAAHAAAYAATSYAAPSSAAAAAGAAEAIADADADAAYWHRANPAALLVRLCTEVTP